MEGKTRERPDAMDITLKRGPRTAAHRDLVLIGAVAVGAAYLCAKLNLSERMLAWTRPFERLQVDELPAVLLVVAISLVWFASRRYFEADRALTLRRAAEVRLAEALSENQQLSQQYVSTQENERKALARDLHDELGQYLNAIKLDAVFLRDATAAELAGRDAASAMILNIDRVSEVVASLIRQLRPVGLDELGICAALEHCVTEWRARLPGVAVDLSFSGDFERLDEARCLVLYRLVQEALTNIARHARAGRVRIDIRGANGALPAPHIEMLIEDDGRGVDRQAARGGLGLVGMRERVSALGGGIDFQSAPGAGFKIHATLPLARTA